MKKAITLISSFTLAVGCLLTPFSALPTVSPANDVIEASAASRPYDDLEITNGYYQFDTGAAIQTVSKTGSEQAFADLRFTFEVPQKAHFKFDNDSDYATYTFTIVREDTDKKSDQVPVYEVKMYACKGILAVGHKQLITSNTSISDTVMRDNSVSLSPTQKSDSYMLYEYEDDGVYFTGTLEGKKYNHEYYTDNGVEDASASAYNLEGYNLDYVMAHSSTTPFFTTTSNVEYPTLYLKLNTNSMFAEYFVVCNVDFYDYVKTDEKWSWEEFKTVKKAVYNETLLNMATIRSETRSCYQVLKNIEAAGALEHEFTDETTLGIVNDILNNTVEETITVKYLKQLGDTPFAVATESKITVPVYNDMTFYDDVCTALGVKSLNCMGATVSHFKRNSFNVYEPVYLSSVKMKALTEDGDFDDYYIDLGQTFNEFVDEVSGQTQGKEVFDPGLFSYVVNEIHKLYPATEGYSADELYGFWGFMVIPETYSTNTIWATFFQIDSTTTGVPRCYEAISTMTISEYWDSMGDYNKSWWQRITHIVKSFVANQGDWRAKYVIYYTNPDISEATFDESGGDGDGTSSGAIIESVKDVLSGIGQTITEYKEEKEADTTRTLMIICGVLGGVVLLGGAAYIYISKKNK